MNTEKYDIRDKKKEKKLHAIQSIISIEIKIETSLSNPKYNKIYVSSSHYKSRYRRIRLGTISSHARSDSTVYKGPRSLPRQY